VPVQVAVVDHDHPLRVAFVQFAVVGRVVTGAVDHDAIPDLGHARDRERLVGPVHRIAGQPRGTLLVGDAGLEFGDDLERMHAEALFEDAAIPNGVQTVA